MTKILVTGGIDENKTYLDSTELLDLVSGPSADCIISNLTKPLARATGGYLPNMGPIICGGSPTEITVAENICYLLSKNSKYIVQSTIRNPNPKYENMFFNFHCTCRWVMFEKLMMKIYDFFIWLSCLVGDSNCVENLSSSQ